MKIIILKNNLREAVAIAERGIGDNTNLPILKNFLIKAEDNSISICSTNLEIGVTAVTSAKVIKPGSITVPANLMSSLVSTITSERLDFEEKSLVLEIKANNYEVSLPLSPVDEFPLIPKIENQKKYLEIHSRVIGDALEQVSTAVQFSEIRPEISGICFLFNPDGLVIAGTDIFRLSEKKISKNLFKSNYEEGFKCIIPLKTVQELIKIFKKEEELKFYFDENQILIKSESSELISRLVNGNFPDYVGLNIIPKSFKTEIEIEREELMSALKLSGVISQSIHEIKLCVGANKKNLEILSAEKSLGKTKSLLAAKIKGEAAEIYFNWRYLFEGLKGFTQKNITLGFNGDDKPAMIASADASYIYILMPVKQ